MDLSSHLKQFQRVNHLILRSITKKPLTIQKTLEAAKKTHERLFTKAESTIILLKEHYKIEDLAPFYQIYKESLIVLLLSVNFKIFNQLSKLSLAIANRPSNQLIDLSYY